jgi:hypothetical protein
MLVMYVSWMLLKRPRPSSAPPTSSTPLLHSPSPTVQVDGWWYSDLVDVETVDLVTDEYEEQEVDGNNDEEVRERRTHGKAGYLWRVVYWLV